MSGRFSLKKKTIIVTGAGGTGMARIVAESMAKEEANFFAIDINLSKPIP